MGLLVVIAVICVLCKAYESGNSDCSNDGFVGVVITDPENRREKKYDKFLITKDNDDTPFTKDKAQAKCEQLGAVLLNVKDDNELSHVLTLPEAQNKILWLENDDDDDGSQHPSLIRGGCSYVPLKTGNRVVKTTTCDGDFWAACVKKNCENPKGDSQSPYDPPADFAH